MTLIDYSALPKFQKKKKRLSGGSYAVRCTFRGQLSCREVERRSGEGAKIIEVAERTDEKGTFRPCS
jgi:hypothetical protein